MYPVNLLVFSSWSAQTRVLGGSAARRQRTLTCPHCHLSWNYSQEICLVHWKSWLKNRWKKTMHLRFYVRLGDGPSPLEEKCWGSLVFCFIHSNAHPGGLFFFFQKVVMTWGFLFGLRAGGVKSWERFFWKKSISNISVTLFSCRDVRFE